MISGCLGMASYSLLRGTIKTFLASDFVTVREYDDGIMKSHLCHLVTGDVYFTVWYRSCFLITGGRKLISCDRELLVVATS